MANKHLILAGLAALMAGCGDMAHAAPQSAYDWASIPFGGGGFVDGFLYHPKQQGILYARTDVGGMYRFDYAAHKWLPLMDGFSKNDWDCFGNVSMAVDPQKPERLYATCGLYLGDRVQAGAVIRSDDMGATWQVTRLPFRLGGNAMGRGTGERLQVDPANSDVLWLGSNADGLWRSGDRGVSFSRVDAFTPKSVTTVLIDGQTIYAGSGEVGDGLYASHDGGKTFARVDGSPALIPHQMALDSDGTLYVTFSDNLGPHGVAGGAVWKLNDGAWSDITPAKPTDQLKFGYSGLDLDRQHPGTLVVTTSDRYPGLDDIYLSHDSGMTWKPVGPQAKHYIGDHAWLKSYFGDDDVNGANRRNMGHWMDAVKINPFDSNELLYGTGYGVWMTHDLGALDSGGSVDFEFADDNLEETVILGLESPPAGPHVLMAAGDVAGSAFDDFLRTPQHGLFAPTHETNQSIAYAELAPNIMARTADQAATSGYYSLDGSETWTPMPSTPRVITDADGHFHTSGKIAVSSLGHTLVWVPEGEPAYASNDMGKTWTAAKGWPASGDRGLEAIADKVNDATFYAFDRNTSTILVSRNRGGDFAPLVTGLPVLQGNQGGQLRAVPGHEGDLWLALATGLYHVSDGQAVAMPGVDLAWQVTFGKAKDVGGYPAVYLWGKVGGVEGLWRSDDTGATWTRINDDAHRFGQMRAIAGDPRQYGVLYIAPDGRGIMVGKPAQ